MSEARRETDPDAPATPVWRKLAWFAGLWAAGLATITVVAYAIRLFIPTG